MQILKSLLLGLVVLVLAACSSSDRPPGVVVAHYPQSSGLYVGSPALCILPDGTYVASHDEFGPNSGYHTRAVGRVYRSEDKGRTWQSVARLEGMLWANLFFHRGELYMICMDREHGNLLARRSTDGGYTWTEPVDSRLGLLREGEYHTAPMPMILHKGRLWRGVENARSPYDQWGKRYSAMLISAPEDADLLDAASWTESEYLPYDSTYLDGRFGAWLEGNAVLSPEGKLVDVLRVDCGACPEVAAIVSVDEATGALSFDPATDFVPMPGGAKKFTIRNDSLTRRYWSLVNYVKPEFREGNPAWVRNTLALTSSEDLRSWTIHRIVLEHPELKHHGFQYIDWLIEGEDIIFLSRTAYDDVDTGAHNSHDANYLTFHRIKKFRKALSERIEK